MKEVVVKSDNVNNTTVNLAFLQPLPLLSIVSQIFQHRKSPLYNASRPAPVFSPS